jgi:acyl carrier protein phosphodiesterase
MNFLAHFYLSGNDTGLLQGNFLADAVKGKKHLEYSAEIQKGILMHRFIDHYTDTHAVTERTKARLRPEFHHYAPVIVDVFYDHFLAINWKQYSEIPLTEYAQMIYSKLEENSDVFPEKSKHILKYMKMHDWLNAYATVEGIGVVLTGMSRRTPYVSGMENGAAALRKDYDACEKDFKEFFPELISATVSYRPSTGSGPTIMA